MLLIGCSPSNYTTDVPKESDVGNKALVQQARAYLKECPSFFIPTNAEPNKNIDGKMKNSSGAAAWTPSGYVSSPPSIDSKYNYTKRLNMASIPNQISYDQYIQLSSSGYPGKIQNQIQSPNMQYQAGYVCYAFVYTAYKDNNSQIYSPYPSWNSDNFLSENQFIQKTESEAKNGDVVAFDWDNNNTYDHVGILTDKFGINSKNWGIIHSNGLIDFFNWGVKETRIDVFESIAGWQYPDYRYKFFRKSGQ